MFLRVLYNDGYHVIMVQGGGELNTELKLLYYGGDILGCIDPIKRKDKLDQFKYCSHVGFTLIF